MQQGTKFFARTVESEPQTEFWELLTQTFSGDMDNPESMTLRNVKTGEILTVDEEVVGVFFFEAEARDDHFVVPEWGSVKFEFKFFK